MNRTPLLILEDDKGVQFIYEEVLGAQYSLTLCGSLKELATTLEEPTGWRLLIADLRLPDGLFTSALEHPEMLGKLRMPFIVVSSLDDRNVLRECFAFGAVDFMTKPLRANELAVKVERCLEAEQPPTGAPALGLRLDHLTMQLHTNSGAAVSLTPKELQIMMMLCKAPDLSASRAAILDRLWGGVKVGTKTFDTHLANLRKKIRAHGYDIVLDPQDDYRLVRCGD